MSIESYIREIIDKNGFISIDEVMNLALNQKPDSYYRIKQPIGVDGDFITSPEISQMFGEIVGIWCIDLWNKLGRPKKSNIVELGAGRGTLMRDVLRTIKHEPEFYNSVNIRIIDINPTLKSIQKDILIDIQQDIKWVNSLSEVEAMPTIIIANEFFDAMPVKEYFKHNMEWKERVVEINNDSELIFGFRPIKKLLFNHLSSKYINAEEGSVVEQSSESTSIIQDISQYINTNNGAALVIDYGYDINPKFRNKDQYISTLQAVKNHKFTSILDSLGNADISAHVDFWALKEAVTCNKASVFGTITQRDLLIKCGIDIRLEYLLRRNPELSEVLINQYNRLTSVEKMGSLFKAMAITSSDDIIPLGFES